MKKLNEKSKAEQLFIVTLMFVALIGVFCITGCGGGKSCATPKCGSEEFYEGTARGCSIPGCGGCLTPERGCNTACWPQECKYVTASSKSENESGEKEVIKISACDTRYYGGGGLGCGQSETVCYSGCLTSENGEDDKAKGFFYGATGKDEKFIGCANGCGGCVGSDYDGAYLIDELESLTGVN